MAVAPDGCARGSDPEVGGCLRGVLIAGTAAAVRGIAMSAPGAIGIRIGWGRGIANKRGSWNEPV